MAAAQEYTQYLTFDVEEELYGIEVKSVREILEMRSITPVPRTAPYLLGVMNVRGRVVPVVDLRLKFGLESAPRTVDSAIMVLDVVDGAGDSLLGLLVDRVDEVLNLEASSIEPPPTVGTTVDGQLLSGTGKKGDQFIMILNTEAVFMADAADVARPGSGDAA